MEPFNVSQSKVKTFRRCHRAYDLRYVQKIRKKEKSRPLHFGSLVHSFLQERIEGRDPFEYLDNERERVRTLKIFLQEQEELLDVIQDVEDIMEAYCEFWDKKSLVYDMIEIDGEMKRCEFNFNIELMPGVNFNGYIDGIATTPNKLRWIVEHKTYNRRPSDNDRWRNLQAAVYIRAIEMLDWGQVEGLAWNYVRSKPPARQQKMLKDGTLSCAKLDTLPGVLEDIIRKWKLDAPKELHKRNYGPLIASTERNCEEYFQRIHTPVQRGVVDMVFEDFENTVRQMVESHGKVSGMNIERHCDWCDYNAICRGFLEGHDVDYIIEKEYEKSV